MQGQRSAKLTNGVPVVPVMKVPFGSKIGRNARKKKMYGAVIAPKNLISNIVCCENAYFL